ncbi:1-deoxy-D-xylulose-5-phosphate synthase [Pseudodesulfovibrio nedwellii]|uniref:1-deoxy-D-xylulose-5-phosphate synthase n=1 Tax=Pseudodesulfovibrio nedwellii TaxID=2973072 RepID=A0ABN6S1Z7_9BACT|nr:transketolase C-terminal domain-containing protein [Pseudodesulfovibrio nedwellii]BDQ37226.1 1-deoxy-D-xylulose-5-phosphate synthase [Pseudodesulfovibrio nedwellii]
MSMRNDFIDALVEQAALDERIVLLTADLGYTVLEKFSDKFPDRYFNVGAAEQNMLGIAAGMTASGLIPFVYSMTTFVTMRSFEFIRNGAALHQLPVRIIGVGGGFDYGHAGPTHHGLEDIALMRALQGVSIYCPLSNNHAQKLLANTWKTDGPIYYRISKDQIDLPNENEISVIPGELHCVRKGENVAIIGLGRCCNEAIEAADALREQGINAAVYGAYSLSPSPEKALVEALNGIKTCVVLEDHSINGGLGSLVAEGIAENRLGCKLIRAGSTGTPKKVCADYAMLKDINKMTTKDIVKKTLSACNN